MKIRQRRGSVLMIDDLESDESTKVAEYFNKGVIFAA
jgi:hypothetical protein